jgi:hypothetical protein
MINQAKSSEGPSMLLSDLRTIMKEGGVCMCGGTLSKGKIIRRRGCWMNGPTIPLWRAKALCKVFDLQLV